MPELLAVTPTPIGALGQHHFRLHNTRLVGEIMAAAKPLIMQPRGRTVGRSGDSAAAASAGHDLCRELVDRHAGVPFTAQSARRPDVSPRPPTIKTADAPVG